MSNQFASTTEKILHVAKKYSLDKKAHALTEIDRIIEVSLPVTIGGKQKILKGFRSQHSNTLGPYKGGIRFHQDVTREEVMALSVWMSLKCALVGLPYGGGKGGVVVNPKDLTESELEALSREYVRKLFDVIGAHKDIPAPDVNTNPKIIDWMSDEYRLLSKRQKTKETTGEQKASFTGKSIQMGGLSGRSEATGYGGAVILKRLIDTLGKKPSNTTVTVQGFGNVGYFFSKFAQENGFVITTVSDSKGGIVHTMGENQSLDIPYVLECKLEKGMLAGCYCVGGVCDIKQGSVITNDEVLSLKTDVLVPSALGDVIHKGNMKSIQAKIIIEMANGPITHEAYEYLTDKGVIIVPDILANAGGVAASYLEWKQNLENTSYDIDYVLNHLKDRMQKAFDQVWDLSKSHKTDLKEAAYLSALQRITKG